MPKQQKPTARPKRPTDVNQLAHQIVPELTTEETPDNGAVTNSDISRVMAALGRKGGKVGGRKRAENLTAKKRSEIALKAARARWNKRTT
jgi:hypothetical protein